MNFDNHIFRSHSVGTIVNVPKPLTANQTETLTDYRNRANGEGRPLTDNQKKTWHSLEHKYNESQTYSLNDTAKKYLTDLVFEARTGRRSKLETKYFSKGIEAEKAGRDLTSRILNIMLIEDDERKSNEWVTGKRDVKSNELIIDIKSAWSFESFNKHLLSTPNEIYLRQLDCYMDLWNIKDSLLVHVLVDTPFNLIDDEIKRMDWKYNISDMNGDIRDEFISDVVDLVSNHIFTRKGLEDYCLESSNVHIEWFDNFIELGDDQRIHMISHSYDQERIEQRNECIKIARQFMNDVRPINNIIK
jgi:hypothetical protein